MIDFEFEIPRDIEYIDWRDLDIGVFDIETTGVDVENDKIVSFALYGTKLVGNSPTKIMGKEWFVNPGVDIPEEASKVHGIWNEDVVNWPTLDEVIEDIMKHVAMFHALSGFNILKFDIPFLINEFERFGYKWPTKPVIDCYIWALQNKAIKRKTQGSVAQFYGVDEMAQVSHGESKLHDALTDTRICSNILWKMAPRDITEYSIGDLVPSQHRLFLKNHRYRQKLEEQKQKRKEKAEKARAKKKAEKK